MCHIQCASDSYALIIGLFGCWFAYSFLNDVLFHCDFFKNDNYRSHPTNNFSLLITYIILAYTLCGR